MTMIDATSNRSEVNNTEPNTNNSISQETNATEPASNTTSPTEQGIEPRLDQNQVLIKTETTAGYVNLGGKERDQVEYDNALKDMLKEQIKFYYNTTEAKMELEEEVENADRSEKEESAQESQEKVDVDDIIVPQKPQEMEKLELPSSKKAKATFNLLLPKVIQDYLNDWKIKPKCEPQYMLERMRREKKYPDHPDMNKYQLLLTPAQSFLQRISLAGEFLSKKHLEM